MKETMRTTLLQFMRTLRAKNASEEKIRWMLEGVMIRAGYEIGLLERGEPIPETIYQHVHAIVQEIMKEPRQTRQEQEQ